MSREIDLRDPARTRLTPARTDRLNDLSEGVSNALAGEHRVRIASFNGLTGNPAVIASDGAVAEAGNYVQRALAHMQSLTPMLGLEAGQAAEYAPDPHVQTASSGAVAVHLQQNYKGIPIFQAAETVRFDPAGRLSETAGSSVTVEGERPVTTRLTAAEAVLAAARHVAVPDDDERGEVDSFGEPLPLPTIDLDGFTPQAIAAFSDRAEQSAVFAAGPFGEEIKAGLLWFPLEGELRLAWEVLLTLPEFQGQYRTLVDAEDGRILYARQLLCSATARGNVFTRHGGAAREVFDFPRALSDYGLPLPADLAPGFPDTWVESDSTIGNCVRAHLGANGATVRGVSQNGTVSFDAAADNDDDQKVVNIFYFNCFMHDFFYLLGFRESDGNFQQNNFGRGGVASDRVDARAHSGAVFGTANMATPVDGSSPVMNMGLVTSTNRHTAFDASVVFHEFTHGVTNRLVGGPLDSRALEEPQSGGMGEGWGDYIACSVLEENTVGSWVVDRPNGIRAFAYDEQFPDGFDDLGRGRYSQVHNIGEIWCAALLAMNRRIGKVLGVQLVVDALKLAPSNPSFLDMRDAILRALDHKRTAGQLGDTEHADALRGIWQAFAKFGMGPAARSNGATLSGVVGDFNMPVLSGGGGGGAALRSEAAPNLSIPDANATGVSSDIQLQGAGSARRIRVGVEITHPFIGDLRLELVSPTGRQAILRNREGGDGDDLTATFDSGSHAALATLAAAPEPAAGTWRLRVRDLASQDLGRLRRWTLEVGT